MIFFEFILLDVCWVSSICNLIFFAIWGKLLVNISSITVCLICMWFPHFNTITMKDSLHEQWAMEWARTTWADAFDQILMCSCVLSFLWLELNKLFHPSAYFLSLLYTSPQFLVFVCGAFLYSHAIDFPLWSILLMQYPCQVCMLQTLSTVLQLGF